MSFVKRIALFLSILSLGGCASLGMPGWYQYHSRPKPPESVYIQKDIVPIYLDTSFSTKELNAIGEAVKDWNTVFNGAVVLQISEQQIDHTNSVAVDQIKKKISTEYAGIYLVGAHEDDELVIEQGIQHGDGVLGWSNGIGNADQIVLLTDRMALLPFHTLITHELGHALGSPHFQFPSLMAPYIGNNQYPCVDLVSMLSVAQQHHLNPAYMNYCRTPNEE